ncbi:hypothetical protein BT96DRAFT_953289 [Gymnopus androsaceus JB14]|uniref:Uncharacterized protein n=1 Tax=Gymnopus androsaceus JB14 TaxID=1447944 RepID=A0A6A4IP07_9AGAR|nr:hypothetical protein BT96DRAFT_953289 [Gymnopus androsaceus JB14]
MSTLPSSKGAVTDPIEKQRVNDDVDRKLRVYSTVAALQESKLPDNKQLDAWLNVVARNIGTDGHGQKLSSQGQKLTGDVRDIIDTLRLFLAEKNSDELIQDFIWNTRDVDASTSLKNDEPAKEGHVLGIEKDKANQDAQQAAHSLRTLMHLLLTNSEARKLISDFSVVGRDLFARGLGKASESLRPNEEELRLADEAHRGEGGAFTVSSPEDRAREQEERGVDGMVKARVPGDVKDQANDFAEGGRRAQDLDARGQEISPSSPRDGAEQVKQEGKIRGEEVKEEAKKRGLMDRFKHAIPQEHQDKAKDHAKRGRDFLTEEYFPPERRDQWIWRAKKVILECQSHPEYQSSLRWLLAYIKEYSQHGRRIINESGGQVTDGVKGNPGLQSTMSELRTIVERFANGRSMQADIWDPVNALIDDAQRDKEFSDWWAEVGEWMEKILLTPGYIMEPSSTNRGRELFEAGKIFYGSGELDEEANEPKRGKYRNHFDNLLNSVGNFVGGMGEDPLNRRLGTDIQRLTKDLLFDAEGKLSFKSELWDDVRSIILPGLIRRIGLVPIPRVEYQDDTLDLVLENLTLSAANLMPKLYGNRNKNWVKFGKWNASNTTSTNKHTLQLHMSHIQTDMRDVAFYFRKKSGLPKLKDSGLADVLIGGEGLSATIHLESTSDPTTLFDIKNINVKHDILYKTLKPLATGLIKKQVQKAVADGIRTGLEWLGEELVTVKDKMNEARAGTGDDEEDVSRWQAMQEAFKRRESSSVSMSRSGSSSQFKVVSNKRNSILANAGHPSGWVNRLDEKEKTIKEVPAGENITGETWKSKAFDVQCLKL